MSRPITSHFAGTWGSIPIGLSGRERLLGQRGRRRAFGLEPGQGALVQDEPPRCPRLCCEPDGPPGLLVGLLHHLQVQFERGMRVQAQQLLFSKQMAVRSRRGVGEEAAQQGEGIAQDGAGIVGLTVGPQQSRQLAAEVHAAFDGQVEQQGKADSSLFAVRKRDVCADREADENILFTGEMLSISLINGL